MSLAVGAASVLVVAFFASIVVPIRGAAIRVGMTPGEVVAAAGPADDLQRHDPTTVAADAWIYLNPLPWSVCARVVHFTNGRVVLVDDYLLWAGDLKVKR